MTDETSGGVESTTAGPSASSGETTADGGDETGIKFDLAAPSDAGGPACTGADPDATLTGVVRAPNGVIPVSGALVYTSVDRPEGIPQHVYCTECVELGCDDRFTTTDVDGSFTLQTVAAEANYLVVQKGQFMRITEIQVDPGPAQAGDEETTLPGENDPANGLYIPRIAVADGAYDRMEDALGKMGLGDTVIAAMEERLVPGTQPFDLYDNGRDPGFDGFTSQGTMTTLLSDPARLAQYHIIFVPCSDGTFDSSLTPVNQQHIRDWVAAGGRWYVADWANEFIEHPFPNYQTLNGEPYNADDLNVYDSLADILDDGLLAWLEALPPALKDINPLNDESHPTLYDLPQLLTVDNWSIVLDTPEVLVPDGMGGQVNVGHKVWLEGEGGVGATGPHPLTVTGQYGCGKIQFTSYHAAEFFNYVGLSPQELVLIYTILEIGVCQAPLPLPEG